MANRHLTRVPLVTVVLIGLAVILLITVVLTGLAVVLLIRATRWMPTQTP